MANKRLAEHKQQQQINETQTAEVTFIIFRRNVGIIKYVSKDYIRNMIHIGFGKVLGVAWGLAIHMQIYHSPTTLNLYKVLLTCTFR
jgi:hypothetical protein